MNLFKSLSLFLFLFFPLGINAQNCNHCDLALIQGAQNEFQSKTSFSHDEAISTLFSKDYDFWNTYQQSTTKSQSLDAAYKLFSGSYDGANSKTISRQTFESMKTNFSSNHELSKEEHVSLSQRIASEAAYSAWTTCVVSTCGDGIFLEKNGTSDDEFIISLNWVTKNNVGVDSVKVTDISSTNLEFIGGELRKGVMLKQYSPLLATYKRVDRNKDVVLSVSVEGLGVRTINIPKYVEVAKAPAYIPPAVPSGTIVAYAGENVPVGWLLCDGSNKNEKQYPALYYAIGTSWGNGDGAAGSFSLPDLRGVFLRGVDGGRGMDPDTATRTRVRNGAHDKGKVGSYQDDALGRHKHLESVNKTDGGHVDADNGSEASGKGYALKSSDNQWNRSRPYTRDAGNSETRPKNVYVHYIIKQ